MNREVRPRMTQREGIKPRHRQHPVRGHRRVTSRRYPGNPQGPHHDRDCSAEEVARECAHIEGLSAEEAPQKPAGPPSRSCTPGSEAAARNSPYRARSRCGGSKTCSHESIREMATCQPLFESGPLCSAPEPVHRLRARSRLATAAASFVFFEDFECRSGG